MEGGFGGREDGVSRGGGKCIERCYNRRRRWKKEDVLIVVLLGVLRLVVPCLSISISSIPVMCVRLVGTK